MQDRNPSTSYDWQLRFLIHWIVQDTDDPLSFLEEVTRATFEKCRIRQQRLPDASFSLDALEYLNRAARRLTRRLFAEPAAIRADHSVCNIPVPHPLCGDSIDLFISWDESETYISNEIKIGDVTNRDADHNLKAVYGPGGKRVDIRLFSHVTFESRRRTFSRKVDEIIGEAVDQAVKENRHQEMSFVRDLEGLQVSRDRGTSAVEARLMLKKVIEQTGVETFVRWLFSDDPAFLDDHPDLFPPKIVAEEKARLSALKSEVAIRKAKSRAFQAIQKVAAEMTRVDSVLLGALRPGRTRS